MTVLALVLVTLAVVVEIVPHPARRRLTDRRRASREGLVRRLRAGVGTGPWESLFEWAARRSGPAVMAGAVGPVLAIVVGILPAIAGMIIAALGTWLTGRAHQSALRRRDLRTLDEALTALAGDLRAGRPPHEALRVAGDAATAANRTGEDAGVVRVFDGAAAIAALGGDVPSHLRAAAAPPGAAGAALSRTAAAWRVSVASGASLAALVDAVVADLRASVEHSRQLTAQLAGPRATAAVLALLPGLGVLLGVAMGARPLDVLLNTPAGQLALLTGTVLDALGVVWTAFLVRDRPMCPS